MQNIVETLSKPVPNAFLERYSQEFGESEVGKDSRVGDQ